MQIILPVATLAPLLWTDLRLDMLESISTVKIGKDEKYEKNLILVSSEVIPITVVQIIL